MDSALPGQPARPFAKGLPQSWIEAQWELQREILPRMRAFGTATAIFIFRQRKPCAKLTPDTCTCMSDRLAGMKPVLPVRVPVSTGTDPVPDPQPDLCAGSLCLPVDPAQILCLRTILPALAVPCI